jgi:hypothetical protein
MVRRMGTTGETITELESVVRDEWRRLLGVKDLPADADFLAHGGHSMLAVRLAARLREATGYPVRAHHLLSDATVAGMARTVWRSATDPDGTGNTAAPAPDDAARPAPADRGTRQVPTSINQAARLALRRGPARWSKPPLVFAIRCEGRVDRQHLADCLTWVARRHSALRTYFPDPHGTAAGTCLAAADVTWSLPLVDLVDLPEPAREAAGRDALDTLHEPFDPARAPLFRGVLLRYDDHHLLGIAIDHTVFDVVSMVPFLRDLERVHAHLTSGRDPAALDVEISDFAPFAAAERARAASPSAEADVAYWADRWAGMGPFPALPLPTRAGGEARPAPARRWRRHLATDRMAALRAGAERRGLTRFMLVATAVFVALRNATGVEDLGLIAPYAGRAAPGALDTVGYFNSRMLLRVSAPRDAGFDTVAAAVRGATTDALRHDTLGFDALLQRLEPGRYLRRPDRPYLFLNVVATPPAPALAGLATELVWPDRPEVYRHFPGLTIVLNLRPAGDAHLSCGYLPELYDVGLVEAYLESVVRLMGI